MEKLNVHWSSANFLFFGKLIIIALYFTGLVKRMGFIDLPLIDIFDNNLGNNTSFYIWQILFFSSSLCIFLNKRPKTFMLFCGFLLVIALLLNPLKFSHFFFYSACLLIGYALSDKTFNLIPIQLAIVYFGAFIDKLVFSQWRNGDFLTAYFQDYSDHSFTNNLGDYLDTHLVIMILTYSTLFIEFLLIILVLIPRYRNLFLSIGLCFHFVSTIVMDSFFDMFIITLLISYFSILKTTINLNKEPDTSSLLKAVKVLLSFNKNNGKTWFSFELNNYIYTNHYALLLNIVLHPTTIIFTVVMMSLSPLVIKQILFLIVILLFFGHIVKRRKAIQKKTVSEQL